MIVNARALILSPNWGLGDGRKMDNLRFMSGKPTASVQLRAFKTRLSRVGSSIISVRFAASLNNNIDQ